MSEKPKCVAFKQLTSPYAPHVTTATATTSVCCFAVDRRTTRLNALHISALSYAHARAEPGPTVLWLRPLLASKAASFTKLGKRSYYKIVISEQCGTFASWDPLWTLPHSSPAASNGHSLFAAPRINHPQRSFPNEHSYRSPPPSLSCHPSVLAAAPTALDQRRCSNAFVSRDSAADFHLCPTVTHGSVQRPSNAPTFSVAPSLGSGERRRTGRRTGRLGPLLFRRGSVARTFLRVRTSRKGNERVGAGGSSQGFLQKRSPRA